MGLYNVKSSVSDFGLYKYDGQEKRCNFQSTKVFVLLLMILVIICTITSLSLHFIPQNSSNNINYDILDPDNTTLYEDFFTDPSENNTIALTEVSKLISMNTLQDNIIQRRNSPPRPFLHGSYDGAIPTSFKSVLSPYNRNKQQENWAQLSYYKSPMNNPKNIQDILNYVTTIDNEKSEADINSAVIQKPIPQFRPDPFYKYRPQEPSDINLLATASFKFAPPIWKNLRTSPKPIAMNKPSILKGSSSSYPIFTVPGTKRPLTVTLNVFPMQGGASNGPHIEHIGPFPIMESESVYRPSYTTPSIGLLDKIKNGYNNLFDRSEKNIMMPTPKSYIPNKMIIHLNLFPNEDIYRSLGYLQRMDKTVEV